MLVFISISADIYMSKSECYMVAILYTFRVIFFIPPHTHFDHVNGFNRKFDLMLDSKSKVHSLPTEFHPLFKNITLLHLQVSII